MELNELLKQITPRPPLTNPRFVWLIGSIKEQFPDVPEDGTYSGTVLWDRQERRPVASLTAGYQQIICLEHQQHGTPFTNLEDWLNQLSDEDLASENLPPTKPEYRAVTGVK